MKNIVEVKNLSIDFRVRDGSFRAVDDISFDNGSNEHAFLKAGLY